MFNSIKKAMETLFFNTGMRLEFNNDGDICEVTGRYHIRGKYKIEYRSLTSGKKYSDLRTDLIQWHNEGILKIK